VHSDIVASHRRVVLNFPFSADSIIHIGAPFSHEDQKAPAQIFNQCETTTEYSRAIESRSYTLTMHTWYSQSCLGMLCTMRSHEIHAARSDELLLDARTIRVLRL